MKVQKVKNLLVAIRDNDDNDLDSRIKLGDSLGSFNLLSGKFFGNMGAYSFLLQEYKKYINEEYNKEKNNVSYKVKTQILRVDLNNHEEIFIPDSNRTLCQFNTFKEADEFTDLFELNFIRLKYNGEEYSDFAVYASNEKINQILKLFKKNEIYKTDEYDELDIIDFFNEKHIVYFKCSFENVIDIRD